MGKTYKVDGNEVNREIELESGEIVIDREGFLHIVDEEEVLTRLKDGVITSDFEIEDLVRIGKIKEIIIE